MLPARLARLVLLLLVLAVVTAPSPAGAASALRAGAGPAATPASGAPAAAAHQAPDDDGDVTDADDDPSEDDGTSDDGTWTDADGTVWVDTDGDGEPDTPQDEADDDDVASDPASAGLRVPSRRRPAAPLPPLVTTATVAGEVAMLRRDGRAAIPRSAPLRVRRVIAAANRIVGLPYKAGGGHARLRDRGYDCSGAVGYALIRPGLLAAPMTSAAFAGWGRSGGGRWLTVYANDGHVYLEVAGLRLDTSPVADPRGGSGPRWRPAVGRRRGFHARHLRGL